VYNKPNGCSATGALVRALITNNNNNNCKDKSPPSEGKIFTPNQDIARIL
jgi:hypothetical protein